MYIKHISVECLQFSHAERPPILDSLAKLRTKIEMMEQLLEVRVSHGVDWCSSAMQCLGHCRLVCVAKEVEFTA